MDIMAIRQIIAVVLILIGLGFIMVSAVGVVRLPDFYTRLHASGIGETIGIFIAFMGLAVIQGLDQTTVKLFIIAIVVYLFNPVGTHMLGRAALKSKLKTRMPEIKEDE